MLWLLLSIWSRVFILVRTVRFKQKITVGMLLPSLQAAGEQLNYLLEEHRGRMRRRKLEQMIQILCCYFKTWNVTSERCTYVKISQGWSPPHFKCLTCLVNIVTTHLCSPKDLCTLTALLQSMKWNKYWNKDKWTSFWQDGCTFTTLHLHSELHGYLLKRPYNWV